VLACSSRVWAANVSNPWQPTLLVRVREYTAGKKKEEPATLAVGRERGDV
jgi:hypothetical protein